MPLPLILDENQRARSLWRAIQDHNAQNAHQPLDIIRVGDPGGPRNGIKDPELLEWSVKTNRIVVTKNVSSLIAHHGNLVASGRTTPGLWVIREGFGIPEILGELLMCSYVLAEQECKSRCLYLPVQ